jgi:hypothetical protein
VIPKEKTGAESCEIFETYNSLSINETSQRKGVSG